MTLSSRITPTICFDGNCYSISTLSIYCCLGGALIMPRSYYSSCAYSGYRPETIRGTSRWASSAVNPDFGRKLFGQTILRLVRRGAHTTVFVLAGVWSAGGFNLASTPTTSGYAIILTTLVGPALHFRATTFVCDAWVVRVLQPMRRWSPERRQSAFPAEF